MTKYFISLLLLFFLTDCKKSDTQVPNVAVNFTIYLTEPAFVHLNTVGNYAYVTGGYNGIIVYHESIDVFAAYDRACPFNPNISAEQVDVDSSGLGLIDYHCGSRFNILGGTVLNGPATQSLRRYAAEYDGLSSIYIHN